MITTHDTFYTRPVIPLLLALISGIVLGNLFPHFVVVPLIVCIGTFVLVIRGIRLNQSLTYAPLLFFGLLGYLLIQSGFQSGKSPGQIGYYTGKGDFVIRGTIETLPELKHYGWKFIMGNLSLETDGEKEKKVSGRISVTVSDTDLVLNPGDRIRFISKIKAFHNFHNKGGFDYKHYMSLQGVYGSAYGKKEDVDVLKSGVPTVMERVRASVERFIDRTPVSVQTREVLKALSTGTRTGITKELQNEFNATGTTHLLSISGLHISIVSGVSFFIFYWMLSFIPALLWKGRLKMAAGLLALGPVWFYGILAGMTPSTARSVIMVSVFLLTFAFEAEHDVINSLFFAALAIIGLAPESLFSVSLQLSFAAVFFIVWGSDLVGQFRSERGGTASAAVTWVKNYGLVSVLAFAGTWPLISHCFNQMSLIGFVANMILIPLMGSLVVIIELAAIFLFPVFTLPASWVMWLAGFILEKSLLLIHMFAKVPFAWITTITPSVVEMTAYYVLICSAILLIGKGETIKKYRRQMALLATTALAVLLIDGVYWFHHRFFHRDLRITYIDVGQGNSALVEFPGGKTMLIDGGGFSDIDSFDIGEKVVGPFLWSKKIGKVDTVVLSHPESDHMNGLIYIIRHFNVDEVWKTNEEKETKSYGYFKSVIREKNVNVPLFDNLQREKTVNGATVQILWPFGASAAGIVDEQEAGNDSSLVLKITFNGHAFLFPGDITEKAENTLAQYAAGNLESTVLLVPHHGSKTSSGRIFLEAVKPKYAVISLGYHNRYRMPHKKVLNRLEDQGIGIYRTDLNGAVEMSVSPGCSLDIRPFMKNVNISEGADG